MDISKLMVIVYASDMNRSFEFYKDKLRLTPRSNEVNPYWNEFHTANSIIALHSDGQPVAALAPAISLVVNDLQSARNECNTRGCNFGEIENPHPGVSFCYTKDPDGVVVYLHA
ncbi:MAG: hypothetical protein KF836_10635 [Fimbriimonadaceae bacterium]|nr:hypothetical protein [Fimbriimonadaceae bacterium]